MTKQEILALAREEGFQAAWIAPEDIPVDAAFRQFCEENTCGKYNATYACPPGCGSAQALHQKILAEDSAIVLTSRWGIQDYGDTENIEFARQCHNDATLRLMQQLRAQGYEGFAAGYHGCSLCSPCKYLLNQPCPHPDRRMICLSAYCVDVALLAQRCRLQYGWDPGELFLFGMICFHKRTDPSATCPGTVG